MMTEIETQYEKHVNLLYKTVWRFIQERGLPPTEFVELLGQANLYFMIAVTSFDANKNTKLSTWIQNQVQRRLQKEHIKREWELIRLSKSNWTSKERRVHECIDLLDELTKDSKILIEMVCQREIDIDKILYTKYRGYPRKRLGIKYVYRFLRGKEWSRVRIHKCFKNLKQLLE